MGTKSVFKNLNIDGEIVDIICEDGIITFIGTCDLDGIDFSGRKAYPGLVDIHTHGMKGIDTMDRDINTLAQFYAKSGTTAFMPTTMTSDNISIKKVLKSDIKVKDGADVIGYHLEGPYINAEYIGAQNPAYLRLPDTEEIKEFENIAMITIAPEIEGAMEFIRKSNAVISLGHTSADYDTGVMAAKSGAKCLTHTFNAMKPIHHRMPGLVGAAFDTDMYVQVICDGIHIHPSVIRMLYKMFGADRMVLISDSIRATGLCDGEYDLGGIMMTVKDGIARTKDGALAGSTSTLFDCVKKAISFGIPEKDAFRMASETPSKLMGIKKGKFAIGYDCDIIILNNLYEIKNVILKGNLIYKGE